MDWFDRIGMSLFWGGGVWQIVAIVLKLTSTVDWSWWIVLIPLLSLGGIFTVLGWVALWQMSQIRF